MEDSKNALFVEPNAYIKNFNNKTKCEVKPIKKVVFSEPYDCMPNFYFDNHFHKNENGYFDNHFQKGNCDCVTKSKHTNCNSKHDSNFCFDNKDDCNCNKSYNSKFQEKGGFGFDIKNFLPILNSFNKGGAGGFNVSSLSSLLGNSNGGFDFSKLLSNPNLIKNIFSLFGGKKQTALKKEDVVCTDYEIKRYTKV